jgi:hypothetical protein
MSAIIGANLSATYTAAELTASGVGFGAGDRFRGHDGKEWVFVKASAAITQYDVCTFDETFITTVAPLSTSNDAFGDKIGVAPVAIASGSWGWLQIYGPCTMNAVASTAANAILGSSATAGHVDDVVSTGFATLDGIALTTARGGTNGSAPGVLNYPVQRTIA